jgi:hypothetical protein
VLVLTSYAAQEVLFISVLVRACGYVLGQRHGGGFAARLVPWD